MKTVMEFTDPGDFIACWAAEEWLKRRGFSVGSMQGPEPRAIWHGDCYISKWRGLSAAEKRDMHASMTGDMRNGPVRITLASAASLEAVAAFNREEEVPA